MITAHHISPLKAKLQKHFEASDEDTALITEMKNVFNNDFEKRYTHLHDLLYTASALDPRFKTLPFLSDNEAERIFTNDDPPRKKKKSAALDQLFGELFEVRAAARSSREKASEEVMREAELPRLGRELTCLRKLISSERWPCPRDTTGTVSRQ
ncbi:hypothetical protein SKAU_G00088680 [Synaphobranchus kaupii]|uniref:Uncharacterized protein n=1 Tax=Synaphobranchus kaupii TaxID=118154 RepID=A0A9Q1FW91_SYNKA|nr:hypothetical protein SKAU_G00088680 [Synaphobranchus kaupii]